MCNGSAAGAAGDLSLGRLTFVGPCAVLLTLCALLLAACANYRLGTGGNLTFRTIYVEPVENRSLLPQAQALVSAQLRQAFARDGRVTLVNSATGADATLSVVLNDFRRDVAAAREDDTGLARKFNVTLTAGCTLRENRTGRVLFENRSVSAQRETFTDSRLAGPQYGGQLQAEHQVLPLLAETLVGKIVHTTLDVW